MGYDPGDVWTPTLTVKNAAGTLTAATVVLSVTSPSGTVTAPATSTATTGIYTATVSLTEQGRWVGKWTVSGAVTGVEVQSAYVRRLGSNIIPLADVKARLNKTLTVDDGEIEDMLDSAIAEYEEYVGPVSGSVTEIFDGGTDTLVLRDPRAAAVTAASYDSGATLTYTDLTVSNGIVRWAYGTAGRFNTGRVTITYTVGALPANHREIITADVAGYFEATQRSTGAGQADFPGEGRFEGAYTGTPRVLFPRIRELARSYPSVA